MRFRANIENVPTFYKIVQAVEKLQDKCVVKFTETEMHIICTSDATDGGVQVWSQVKVDSLFVEYRIQSNTNNQITLSMSSEALLTTLRSACTPSNNTGLITDAEVVMKLAKKNDQAVLTFEILGATRGNRRVRVTQDIRIEVMKLQDVERLQEPLCPEPDVHILLPPLSKLRTIMDRLKTQSDFIAIRANRAGRLQISVSTDNVKTDVAWTNLSNPPMTRDAASQDPTQIVRPQDKEKMFGVLVSIKCFMKFLSSYVISTTTIACICQNHCMILYVYIGEMADAGGVLTFYVPVVVDD